MKKIYYFIFLVILLTSCSKNEKKNMIEQKGIIEASLIETLHTSDSLYQLGQIDTAIFNKFINNALNYSINYPEESNTPKMLEKAGWLTMVIGQSTSDKKVALHYANMGIDIFNKIQKVYPDYEGVKYCYYNRGIIYDDIVHDYASAEIEFRDFIHKYPDDELTESIRSYLEIIGLSESKLNQKFNLDKNSN